MQIRDTRNGSWYWVNTAVNACPHITPADKCVYGALASFGGCKDIHPSFELIAQRSSLTERMAMKAVKKMIKVGLLSVEKGGGRGNANVYNLLKCPKGCVKCQKGEQINSEQINSVSIGQERVNKKTIKGEQNSTPIDNELDKEIDNSFERFYNSYPRKIGKVVVRKLWVKLNPSKELTEKIITSVAEHLKTEQWQENQRFIPHPATYLSQKRWEDEIKLLTSSVTRIK